MSNYVSCPNCDTAIDATAASLDGRCPECETPFNDLVYDDGPASPEIDYGPPEGHE